MSVLITHKNCCGKRTILIHNKMCICAIMHKFENKFLKNNKIK